MTDHNALIEAILANRDDDTPRLAFADWCDENGQSERAEFIRCQIELVTTISPAYREVIVDGIDWSDLETGVYSEELKRAVKLRRREQELLVAPRIGEWAGQELRPLWVDRVAERTLYGRRELPEYPFEFTRGFVSSVECEWSVWAAHSTAILKNHPIERVKLTTRPSSDELAAFMRTILMTPVIGTCKQFLEMCWARIAFELPPENHFAIRFQQSDSQEGPWTDIPANDQITAGYMRAVAQSAAPGEAVTIQYHPR